MLLHLYRDIQKFKPANKKFWDFIDSEKIYVYRGAEDKEFDINKKFISFTLDKDIAIRFTQPNWILRAFIDRNEQNGYLFKVKTLVKDVHIYNDVGSEKEVILKSPIKNYKLYKVSKGKIKNG